jgi:hypothetical protein
MAYKTGDVWWSDDSVAGVKWTEASWKSHLLFPSSYEVILGNVDGKTLLRNLHVVFEADVSLINATITQYEVPSVHLQTSSTNVQIWPPGGVFPFCLIPSAFLFVKASEPFVLRGETAAADPTWLDSMVKSRTGDLVFATPDPGPVPVITMRGVLQWRLPAVHPVVTRAELAAALAVHERTLEAANRVLVQTWLDDLRSTLRGTLLEAAGKGQCQYVLQGPTLTVPPRATLPAYQRHMDHEVLDTPLRFQVATLLPCLMLKEMDTPWTWQLSW